ncbi:MAG: DinB family protein [Alphaproteobacteria bacterium]
MIDAEFVRVMARYNEWQNRNLYDAADGLSDADRRRDRGAFFGSIHATLCHLLWGDGMWMHRFAGLPKPDGPISGSVDMVGDWPELRAARADMDAAILSWATSLSSDWLVGDLTWYSGAAGRDLSRPKATLVTHFFNHQTHHRGQVHAMLTAAGARPGDTDLMLMGDAV